MSDTKTTFHEVLKQIITFRDERNWKKYHHPRKLATSITLEAAELLEHFQWDDDQKISELKKDKEKFEEMKSELADIMIYAFEFADSLGIDISEAMLEKLEKVKLKFPVEQFKDVRSDLGVYRQIKAKYRQKSR